MRPASDTARRDVSPLLGKSDDESEADRGASSTKRCSILPRRCGGAGSSTSVGPHSGLSLVEVKKLQASMA